MWSNVFCCNLDHLTVPVMVLLQMHFLRPAPRAPSAPALSPGTWSQSSAQMAGFLGPSGMLLATQKLASVVKVVTEFPPKIKCSLLDRSAG